MDKDKFFSFAARLDRKEKVVAISNKHPDVERQLQALQDLRGVYKLRDRLQALGWGDEINGAIENEAAAVGDSLKCVEYQDVFAPVKTVLGSREAEIVRTNGAAL